LGRNRKGKKRKREGERCRLARTRDEHWTERTIYRKEKKKGRQCATTPLGPGLVLTTQLFRALFKEGGRVPKHFLLKSDAEDFFLERVDTLEAGVEEWLDGLTLVRARSDE
jgi:hypothetical protein